MMPRIIVRAVPERVACVRYLKERLPRAEWCFDKRRDAMDTFLRALEMAGDDPAIHMEEDTILAKDFEPRVLKAISERPCSVVQFFSMRKADLEIGSRWESSFIMGQCFYLPGGYSTEIRRYYRDWPRREEHPTGLDLMVNDWLRLIKEKHWIHVPSLVDHREGKSAIDPRRSSKRQSKTFEGET